MKNLSSTLQKKFISSWLGMRLPVLPWEVVKLLIILPSSDSCAAMQPYAARLTPHIHFQGLGSSLFFSFRLDDDTRACSGFLFR